MRLLALLVPVLLVSPLPAQPMQCDGRFKGGALSEQLLKRMLEKHAQWVSETREGTVTTRRPNFCGTDLSRTSLRSANLYRADLRGANLSGADLWNIELSKAILTNANLSKAFLQDANLSGAFLSDADLSGAFLTGANLSLTPLWRTKLMGATLERANLSQASLWQANLSGALLRNANLSKASLNEANLERANLSEANLAGASLSASNLKLANLELADLNLAKLIGSDLEGANLSRIEMRDANLTGANLQEVDFTGANLHGVDFSEANLQGVDLSGANLSEAKLEYANLTGASYEPAAGQQPPVDAIATAEGLSTLRYEKPRALVNLRKQFKDAGYREQERQITYAIRRGATQEQLAGKAGDFGVLEGMLSHVLFELTTKWGMAPGRALIGLVLLIPFFALFYVIAIWKPSPTGIMWRTKEDGIWQHWSEERSRADLGGDKPTLLLERGSAAVAYALYFSLLSAFHIGWRDLNVGNWIARIQPREYTLRASGWVRTVSGIQSLISVYLLAIWALTYFGRPFE